MYHIDCTRNIIDLSVCYYTQNNLYANIKVVLCMHDKNYELLYETFDKSLLLWSQCATLRFFL